MINLPPLPIEPALPQLVEALRRERRAVLVAPPGAGKTLRVPMAIARSDAAKKGHVIVLEPRRMAARACAHAMAEVHRERLGDYVGYQVRFDKRAGPSTKVLVVTEGILNRYLASDPFLESCSCVVIDEFHERSVHADLALAFCRELLEARDDFHLVVMSATIDPGPVSRYLNDAPVISTEGRMYPVSTRYLPREDDRPLYARVAAGVRSMLGSEDDDGGNVLAFLPGAKEIHAAARQLRENPLPGDPEIKTLYGALPAVEQDDVLRPCARRRIVLSTNIAQTSLTIPKVTCVVDCGLVKQLRADPRTGLDRLETISISKDSADQRAGRAGRTAPGRVLRLWTRARHQTLLPHDIPEIRRVDLCSALLAVLAFHPGPLEDFPFFEAPGPSALDAGLEALRMLGAVDDEGCRLSPRGQIYANLPVHPRLSAVLVEGSRLKDASRAAFCAAILSERDVTTSEGIAASAIFQKTPCDIADRAFRLERFAASRGQSADASSLGLRHGAARDVLATRDRLLRLAQTLEPPAPGAHDQTSGFGSLLLAGFPDRVCCRRSAGSREAVMVGGAGVELHEDSVVDEGSLFLALDAEGGSGPKRRNALVRMASRIELEDLERIFPEAVTEETAARFDPSTESVKGVRRRVYLGLVLHEEHSAAVPAEKIHEALMAVAAGSFQRIFRPDAAAQTLIDRLRFARWALSEEAWPDLSEDGLMEILRHASSGARSFDDLRTMDWSAALRAKLPYHLRAILDAEVPESVQVPSGRQLRLDYAPAQAPGAPPVLAVKLQEMFGCSVTPKIARGRVAVLLHLLAPNGRPAQVTTDLGNFWKSTYIEVRKELAGRYPKHPWPEDPGSAEPTARAKPRKKR